MPGLDPGIQEPQCLDLKEPWVAGSSPAMTNKGQYQAPLALSKKEVLLAQGGQPIKKMASRHRLAYRMFTPHHCYGLKGIPSS